jgi:hypothetical protein
MADRLNASAKSVLYLYGITQAPETLPPILRGVDGISSVEAVDCSGFTCWVSRVRAGEFGGKLAQNMENLEWLAEASVRHQRVVGAIHEQQPILPARFGTVFLNQDSLADDVAGRKTTLKASFRRISGADEWGIRVFASPKTVAVSASARSGKEYLQRKSALLQARTARTLEPEIKEFANAVAKLATASAEGGKVSSGQAGLRWQTSVLLPRPRRPRLEALLARFARKEQDRFRVECTGPWPPYSFVGEKAHPRPAQRAQPGVTR